jgi:hypothetical protein
VLSFLPLKQLSFYLKERDPETLRDQINLMTVLKTSSGAMFVMQAKSLPHSSGSRSTLQPAHGTRRLIM